MQKSKGFTIIELLVVVSIIAVLTGIVLVNVTTYINKGKDAAAQGNLSTMLTNGAVFYDREGDYVGWITGACAGDPGFTGPCNAILSAGYSAVTANCETAACASPSTKLFAQVSLKATTNAFCVDSSGAKVNKAGGTCPAAGQTNAGTCQ